MCKRLLVALVLTVLLLVQISVAQAPAHVAASGPLFSSMQVLIDQEAAEFGVSGYWMERVTWCESSWDPYVTNPWTGAAGIAQWMPATFWSLVYRLWWPAGTWLSPYNPYVALRLMAWYWSQGGASSWTCSYLTGYL